MGTMDETIAQLEAKIAQLQHENHQLRCGWAFASASHQHGIVIAMQRGVDLHDLDEKPAINFSRDTPMDIAEKLKQRAARTNELCSAALEAFGRNGASNL